MGTRLRPYTLRTPKPMLPVGGRPILERIIVWLRENGVTEVVISTGYLGKKIERYFRDGARLGVRIEYATAEKPLGIAGQLRNASPKLPDRFVCLYGDAILDFDLEPLLQLHAREGALLTMALLKERIKSRYGVIDLGPDGRVSSWREKPVFENDINVGCYVMQKRYLRYIPRAEEADMKETFDAAMAAREPIFGLRVGGEFWDIGDKEAYRAADAHFTQKEK